MATLNIGHDMMNEKVTEKWDVSITVSCVVNVVILISRITI